VTFAAGAGAIGQARGHSLQAECLGRRLALLRCISLGVVGGRVFGVLRSSAACRRTRGALECRAFLSTSLPRFTLLHTYTYRPRQHAMPIFTVDCYGFQNDSWYWLIITGTFKSPTIPPLPTYLHALSGSSPCHATTT
jgi:hypothetical protein